MNRCSLLCQVITPMFIAGADSRTPELRPSEFKGMMRFWWRAIRAESDIDKLKKEEAEIFGGTGEKEGKSKVRIKVIPQRAHQFIGWNLKNDYGLDWHFDKDTQSLAGKDAGIGYLLYSTVLPRQERKFIKDGFEFNIELSSFDEKSFKNAIASLWASIYLGGFGTRARRGGGNIIVKKIEGETYGINFIPKGSSSDEIFNWLKGNLHKCFEIVRGGLPSNFVSEYSNLSFSRIIISNQLFPNWKDALNNIGKIYLDFRKEHKSNVLDTAVFGLPRKHAIAEKGNIKINRRSSPLIFKLIKTINGFAWLVIRLSSEFLEEGTIIKAGSRIQKPDYKLIDEFWNELKNKGKEYILSQPKILNNIIHKIENQILPKKIILFGSRARGDAHRNADIDIAVESGKFIGGIDIIAPIDIVDLKKANKELKEKIEREGIIIYERKG
ncbi:type III-B CRISPR module RAMP protein Cmr1 [Thermodesulfovibrio sp. 3462-1]|uniref:Type III-B CRISPR module RAMP protein Cmr1 n=1 Tax=Thermodesulfovibrio obliviosus TaxID=3118332 RepID=A0AAU8H5S7_9BACT